jgi:N,N'-diacetylchitobiose transport system substrate-binding protein
MLPFASFLLMAGGQGEEGEGTKEITVWIMQPGSDALQNMIEGFTEDFEAETGAQVNLIFQPWANAHDAFTTGIAAGETPDVAEMGTTWTAEFGELGAFAEQELENPDDYVPGMVESASPQGTPLGLPWYAAARALIYNATVFEDLQLDPPETWQELVEVGQTIQEETDMHAYSVVGAGANHFVLPKVWQAGGTIAERNDDGSWTATINEPAGVEAFDFYGRLFSEYNFSPDGALNWNVNDAQSAFVNEDLAMFVGLGSNLDVVRSEDPDFEPGVAMLPKGPGGNRDTLAGGSHLVRFADSDAPELAQAYIEFLLQDERVAKFAKEVGFFPGTVSGIEAMELNKHDEVFAEMLVNHTRSYPPAAEWGSFEGSDLFTSAVQRIMKGADAQTVLDEVAKEMNAEFSD